MQIYINGKGRIRLSEAMRRAGYSDAVCKTPSNMTEKMGWKILVEQYFPDETILRTHERGLNAKTHALVYKEVEETDKDGKVNKVCRNVSVEVDDMAMQLKALDMLYKIREKYPKDKAPIQINTFSLSDMAKLEDKIEKEGIDI